MKTMIALLLVLLLGAFSSPRYYQFRMTEAQANYHWQNLENIKAYLDISVLPHSQVKLALSAIDSLQKDMQLGLSIDSIGLRKGSE